MEYQYFLPIISNNLPKELYIYPDFIKFIQNESLVTLDEFADLLVMTMPSPRMNWYAHSNFDDTQKGIT
jgi:hypothetical protein